MIEPMQASSVTATALDLHFGRRAVLSGIDLAVGPGQVHGVLGPHGCGKSVLLSVLAGDLVPSGGSVSAEGAVLITDEHGAALTLARALAGAPLVLLIDEPSKGYDAATRVAVRELVERHARRGGTALWATHRLDTLNGVATSMTLLAGGRVRYSGSVEALVLRSLAESAEALVDRLDRAA
jgi:ABC-type multidrug transport system ATPase subunit